MINLLSCLRLVLILLLLMPATALGDGEQWDLFVEAEQHMLSLINSARANPTQAILDCGMDPETVMAAAPEQGASLLEGMPPLAANDRLNASARMHTADLLTANMPNLNGREGSDGSTYEERIEAAGYDAVESGESIGFIAFFNFIDPVAAAESIFRNMLRDELDPAKGAQRNILNPDMTDIGIGFSSGQVVLDQRRYNVYLATCDFGSDVTRNITARGAESTLMILVNQARMRPLDVAVVLGIDIGALQAQDPERVAVWAAGMRPVGRNEALTAAAKAHTRDMAVHAYVSRQDRFGNGYAQRIADSGYDADAPTGERLGYRILEDSAVLSVEMQRLFESVMRSEFAAPPEGVTILNPGFREVGIGFALTALAGEGGVRKALVMTLDWGASAGAPLSAEGWVYRDRNGDGLYAMGEGVFGVPVLAVGYERLPGEWIPSEIAYPERYTDGAGRFSLPDVSRMLKLWVGEEYRVVGNVAAAYRELVFEMPVNAP